MRDISKIENSTFSVAPTSVRIADLIQEEVSEIQPHAERKGLKLLCDIEDSGIVFQSVRCECGLFIFPLHLI